MIVGASLPLAASAPMDKRARFPRGLMKFALLYLVADHERHGYELMREFRRNGWGSPSPGSIYPLLAILESDGLLVSREEDSKRLYTITDAGRHTLAHHEARVRDLIKRSQSHDRMRTQDDWEELQVSARRLLHAVSQIDPASAADTIGNVRVVLDTARRDVYRILSAE